MHSCTCVYSATFLPRDSSNFPKIPKISQNFSQDFPKICGYLHTQHPYTSVTRPRPIQLSTSYHHRFIRCEFIEWFLSITHLANEPKNSSNHHLGNGDSIWKNTVFQKYHTYNRTLKNSSNFGKISQLGNSPSITRGWYFFFKKTCFFTFFWVKWTARGRY